MAMPPCPGQDRVDKHQIRPRFVLPVFAYFANFAVEKSPVPITPNKKSGNRERYEKSEKCRCRMWGRTAQFLWTVHSMGLWLGKHTTCEGFRVQKNGEQN